MPRKSDPCVYYNKAEGFTIWCKKFLWFTIILKFKVFLSFETEAIKVKRWPITTTFFSVDFKEHGKGGFKFRDGQYLHFGKIIQWKTIFCEIRVFLSSMRKTKVIHPNTPKKHLQFQYSRRTWNDGGAFQAVSWKVTAMARPLLKCLGKTDLRGGLYLHSKFYFYPGFVLFIYISIRQNIPSFYC